MGEDRESKHKRHKKHSSSSSKKKHKHKSEHKHKSSSSKKHHHHKHGRSHKKYKHKDKKKSEEVNLQSALENLEILEDILKTSAEYSPEELMAQVLNESQVSGGLVEDSEDSSSDSDASLKLGDNLAGSPPAAVIDLASGMVKTEDAQVGSSDGKGSSPAPALELAKSLQQGAKKEPISPHTASEQGTKDDHKSETASCVEHSTISKESTPSSSQEVEHEPSVTTKVVSKVPSSKDVKAEEAMADSSSDSETERKRKSRKTSSSGGSVFKPFSKNVKALGSKTEIKIKIHQKETDKSKKDGSSSDPPKENGGHKSVDVKLNSTKEKERDSKRRKPSSRRSRTRSRSHSRHRSRSTSRSRHRRRHSRSRSRTPRRRRSRSRSRSYSRRSHRGRSHSHSRRRSRSRSYTRSRRRSRTRLHSRSRHRSRSRSRSRSRRRSRSRSRSYSSTPPLSKKSKSVTNNQKSNNIIKSDEKVAAVENSGDKKTKISELTAFCKDLQEKQAHEDVHGDAPQAEESAQIHHPFAVAPSKPTTFFQNQPTLIFHNNAWKTTSQLAIEAAVSEAHKPLIEKFPVSAGLQHTREETEVGPGTSNVFAHYQELSKMSVSDLVAKRMDIQRQILINPTDVDAHKALNYIQQQTSMWAESQVAPGKYTGQKKLTPLSKEVHNTGFQAWAKKDMFKGLAPVGDGFGRKMLMKMGWKEGQPIGKQGEGHVEPIRVEVKINRSGLATQSDYSKVGSIQPAAVLRATKSEMKMSSLVQGKHPVSALQELCARKKWDPPSYILKEDTGPAHLKMFLYQVNIPLGTFQPAVGSNNKKLAKMQAATAALQGLGLLEKTIEYTSV